MNVFKGKASERAYIEANQNDPDCYVLNITETRESMDDITIHRVTCGSITRRSRASEEFSKRCGRREELEAWANRQSCGLNYCPCMRRLQ